MTLRARTTSTVQRARRQTGAHLERAAAQCAQAMLFRTQCRWRSRCVHDSEPPVSVSLHCSALLALHAAPPFNLNHCMHANRSVSVFDRTATTRALVPTERSQDVQVYPATLQYLGQGTSNIMAIFWFGTLLMLGIDSLLAMVEGATQSTGTVLTFMLERKLDRCNDTCPSPA
jgi:hypothetical protein